MDACPRCAIAKRRLTHHHLSVVANERLALSQGARHRRGGSGMIIEVRRWYSAYAGFFWS